MERGRFFGSGKSCRLALFAAGCLAGLGLSQQALAVGDVVISQVWGGTSSTTGNANHPKADYVEIFNRTANPVDITGWSLNVDTTTGSSWTKLDLPGVMIPAYSYFLIQVSATANAGIDLPTPDASFSPGTFSELSTTGKVALRRTTAAIGAVTCPPIDADLVDLVTYSTSTGTCFEGSGRAPITTTTGSGTAIFRAAGGCTDTDDNLADFATGVPAPRNSSTPSPGGCTSGACCNDTTGACSTVLGASNCPAGSTYEGDNTTCSPGTCPDTGSCCNDCTFACSVTTQVGCPTGSTWSIAQVCSPNPCPMNYPNPANDLPCNAISLTPGVMLTGQVGSATALENGPDSTCQANAGKAVWYKFQPPTSGYYTISTCGATFDDVLAVFTGVCTLPGSLVEVACDDDVCAGGAGEPVVCGTGSSSGFAAVINFVHLDSSIEYLVRVQALTATSLGGTFPIIVNATAAGACCNDTTGACTTALANSCTAGSTYQGDGTVCNPTPCFTGACCNTITGNCTITAPTGCSAGTYQGNNTVCDPSPCPAQADVSVVLTTPLTGSCVSAGTALTTAYTVSNAGPTDATNVTISVVTPAPFGFTGSTPSGTLANGTVTANLGTITVGNSVLVTLSGTAVGGTGGMAASISRDQPDPGTANNSTSTQNVLVTPASTSAVQVLLSDIAGDPTNTLSVGSIGAGTETFSRPYVSPDGGRYIMSVDTTLATTQDRVLVVGTTNPFTATVVAQEGVTTLDLGDAAGEFGYGMGINNAGQYVWGTNTNNTDTNIDEVIVKSTGSTHTVIAREAGAVAAIGGATYDEPFSAYGIRENGNVSFFANLDGLTTATDTAVFDDDGATLIGQEGVTVPGNSTDAYDTGFTDVGSGDVGQGMSVAGTTGYTLSANLLGDTAADDVVVVDGNVVLREGMTLPGFADPIVLIAYNNHALNGDWLAYGTTGGTQALDWCVRNGTVVAKTGDPIHSGAAEQWDDGIFSQTFFGFVANAMGEYAIAGTFAINGAVSTASNAVIVANGQTAVVRENDPVDLNGNGLLDDDTFISTFRDDRMFLTNDGWLYFTARLRTGATACSGGTTDSAHAFMRINIRQNGACCSGSSCTISSQAACTGPNSSFSGTGTACNAPGNNTTPCCRADYNQSGSISVQDIFDYLAGYFSNNANADINDSGAVTVQDIFDFLAAYFSAGC